jgi:hypothetical protein
MIRRIAKLIVCFLLSLLSASLLKAQSEKKETTDTTIIKKDSTVKEKSYFKFDANFLTNSVYLGRKDSLNLPYITPTITYCNKSGLYISASLGYLASSASKKIDYYSFDAGYEFNITKKFSGSVSANKSIYNDSSSNVSSSVGGSLSGSLTYDFGFLELNSGVSASFADKTDLGVDVTVSHSFYLGEEGKQWTITPKALVNFSTLHFYEGYTNKKIGKRQKFPLIISSTSTTTITNKNSNNITLLDFELSVPVSYDTKKWGIYCTPTIAVPQNAIYTTTVTDIKKRDPSNLTSIISQQITTNSTPDSEKKLSNSFYVEVGVYFKF